MWILVLNGIGEMQLNIEIFVVNILFMQNIEGGSYLGLVLWSFIVFCVCGYILNIVVVFQNILENYLEVQWWEK